MKRTLTYYISESDCGLRAEQYLRRRGYSGQILAQLKKDPCRLLCNELPCRLSQRLCMGDMLTAVIPEDAGPSVRPVKLPFTVCYEDEDIIVVSKPAYMPTHPSRSNPCNSLANGLAWYYQEKGIPFVFRCCNRLDRDTSGLTVAAKHMLSAAILSSMSVRHEIRREYRAIVRGSVMPPQGTIRAPLSRKPGSLLEQFVDWEHGEAAVTHYQVIGEQNGHSLLSVILETGRTHQIRVHLKSIGCPLIGDYLYNPDMEWISRQALHSFRLSFAHPITGESMTFTAPMPADMLHVLYPESDPIYSEINPIFPKCDPLSSEHDPHGK